MKQYRTLINVVVCVAWIELCVMVISPHIANEWLNMLIAGLGGGIIAYLLHRSDS